LVVVESANKQMLGWSLNDFKHTDIDHMTKVDYESKLNQSSSLA